MKDIDIFCKNSDMPLSLPFKNVDNLYTNSDMLLFATTENIVIFLKNLAKCYKCYKSVTPKTFQKSVNYNNNNNNVTCNTHIYIKNIYIYKYIYYVRTMYSYSDAYIYIYILYKKCYMLQKWTFCSYYLYSLPVTKVLQKCYKCYKVQKLNKIGVFFVIFALNRVTHFFCYWAKENIGRAKKIDYN